VDSPFDPDDREGSTPEPTAIYVEASDGGVARANWFGRAVDLKLFSAVVILVFGTLWLLAPVPIWALVAAAVIILGVSRFSPRVVRADARRAKPMTGPVVWPNPSMKAVAEALPDPCIMTDAQGIVRFVNDLATQRFGIVTRGDPLSFKIRATALNDALERVVTLDRPETAQWQEKIPTERWLEAHLAPIHLQSDPRATLRRPDFVIVVIEDLTEQRRSERMRADFVANASHELRTPLASLTGFIETLQGPARNDTVAREKFLAIMAQQASRMKRLIDDLLSLSRIEMKAHMRPDTIVELNEILRHVVDSLSPLATENGVDIAIDVTGQSMPTRGDRDELVQVFSNLIENAIKYGASGKRVDVSAAADAQAAGVWLVTVRDYGPGIAQEHLPRLTERFYRADIMSSREKQGTGLGLAIVKHILTRHHARLQIESAVGQGAIFSVRLEAEVAAIKSMTASPQEPRPTPRQTGARAGRAR
jgi:two-component system phosphate regulon sensor histidine kinase PhoR